MNDFVIRLHHAERAGTHHDLHLNGESYAVPKLVPRTSDVRVLAIRTAYHSPEQARFSGTIEEGYGKGTCEVVDEGEMTMIESTPTKRFFNLQGDIYRGNYVLVKTPRYNKNAWLLWKQ